MTPASIAAADVAGSDPGHARVLGALVADSVPQLHREGRRLIDQAAQPLEIDLAEITRADSAGLALLVDWLAYAAQRGKSLRYMRLPPMLTALAGLSEVTSLVESDVQSDVAEPKPARG